MMKMIYNYNKLVRDKIPEEINNIDGRKANYKILNDNEYIQELDKKLFEEAHEFIEEHSVEELADLMEVIHAIMKTKNISFEELYLQADAILYKIKKTTKNGYLIKDLQ